MMISPESYYELNLKGKSQKEIMHEIQSLKREINRLKRIIETPSPDIEAFESPVPLTRLKCSREYLDRAIRAYEEAGGTYKLTKMEQKSRDFDQALDSIKTMIFSIGGFFGGFEKRIYTVSGERIKLIIEHDMFENPSDQPTCYPFMKDEFIARLRAFHIGEWKKEYCDPYVMDGTQWELEIMFTEERKPVQISGSNAYPYNFEDLTEFLGLEEEDEIDDTDTD